MRGTQSGIPPLPPGVACQNATPMSCMYMPECLDFEVRPFPQDIHHLLVWQRGAHARAPAGFHYAGRVWIVWVGVLGDGPGPELWRVRRSLHASAVRAATALCELACGPARSLAVSSHSPPQCVVLPLTLTHAPRCAWMTRAYSLRRYRTWYTRRCSSSMLLGARRRASGRAAEASRAPWGSPCTQTSPQGLPLGRRRRRGRAEGPRPRGQGRAAQPLQKSPRGCRTQKQRWGRCV